MNMNHTLTRLHHHILALSSSTATRTRTTTTTRKQRTPPPPLASLQRRLHPDPSSTTTTTSTTSHNVNTNDALLAYRLTGLSQTKLDHLQAEAWSNPEHVDLRRLVGNVFVNRAATDWVQRDLTRREGEDDMEEKNKKKDKMKKMKKKKAPEMVIRVERRFEIS
ncbi:hypothetical protein VTN02DRAFT_2950 [Thermoascus thermophilus]